MSAELLGQSRGSSHQGDSLFERSILSLAFVPVGLLLLLVALLWYDAWPALARYGVRFFTTNTWDPVFENFGAAAFIYGTVITSLLGLVIATPLAIGAALFLAAYAPEWLQGPVAFTIELLAAIPSIIYGLWGFFVLAPLMRSTVEPFLKETLGAIPILGALFSGPTIGKDLLTAGLILAIMILPTITSISREVIRSVPDNQREGMLGLGATRFEMIRYAVLPYARPGLIGAAILGLARALGETMAVTMVIGNSSTRITPSLFTPGYTLASVIANQFTEADKEIYFSAIVALSLVLLLVSLVLNVMARVLVARTTRGPLGVRN
ncbi:MAG: phosphate ABC transporter permease subunit PstC [Anaerolineae bacterium]|nr:phosphate ABC transporter permease subunit PstC [Anaerolineae bacterium]